MVGVDGAIAILWVVKLAGVGVGGVVVVDGGGTGVGAEKNPGPVRGIIYVRPNWMIKGLEIHVYYRTGRGENPKKVRQPQPGSRRASQADRGGLNKIIS